MSRRQKTEQPKKFTNEFNMFKDIHALCLTIEPRLKYYRDYIQPACVDRDILVEPFLVGKDIVDTDDLPPLSPSSTHYPTWRDTPRPYNAWKAHRRMIELAKSRSWTRVLMLEDDVEFAADYEYVIEAVTPFFQETFSPFVYLGCYLQDGCYEQVAENIVKVTGVGGYHAVIIHHSMYDKLLAMNPLGPYDEMTSRFLLPKYESYAIIPQVVNQRDGFSFIEQSELKKPRRFAT